MKSPLFALATAFLLIAANANAVTCVEGVRRAGCETSKGAVVVNKPVAEVPVVKTPANAVVVEPAKEVVVKPKAEVVPECRMVEGKRVCR